jgi:WD40 repeat protein
VSAIAAPASPYKGLAPFEDSDLDALLFFGREREAEVIAANLMASRLTVLYGPSGVGKTSLLRAGVAHRLRRAQDALVVVVSAWTGDPVGELLGALEEAAPGEALRRSGSLADVLTAWTRRLDSDIYLVLDQFEEYFLYHEGEGGPATLSEELPEALRRGGLRANFLLGIREDSLAQLDAFKPRIPNLFANSLRLDRLDEYAGRAAIVGPLERYNELVDRSAQVSAEPELVDAVLRQVAVGRVDLGQSGRGGVGDADGDRIEAPYLQLVLERLWAVESERGSRRLRLATLVELGGAAQIVEDHLERAMAELSPEEKDAAAAIYNHLVTPSGTKIAHRAGDLAGYASVWEDEAEQVLNRLVEERIVRAGEDGAAGPRYEIYHDVLAEAVLAWRTRHEAGRRLEAERRAAALRHRRLLVVAIGAAVLMAILAGIAVYALVQRHDAQAKARHARAQELVALAAAELPVDPERSVALAVEAAGRERSPGVEDELRTSLLALRVREVLHAGGAASAVAVEPRGRLIVTSGKGGARLFDRRTGRAIATLTRDATLTTVSFSPDGRLIAAAGTNGLARVWSTRDKRQILALRHGSAVTSVAFSPDSRLLATTSGDRSARIWRVPSGRLVHRLPHPAAVRSASFDGTGGLLVTAADDPVARVFDVHSGRLLRRLVHPHVLSLARFAPRGALVATASPDRMVRIWDGRTGRLHHVLRGQKGQILDVEFNPDGTRVVSASADEGARVWDTGTGLVTSVLLGHTGFVVRARFSPDGKSVATASVDHTARLFDAETGTPKAAFLGHRDAVADLAFGPRGRTLVTASRDGTARVWDARPTRELEPLGARGRVSSIAFGGDDRTVVSASGGDERPASATIWRLPGGRAVDRRLQKRATASAVAPGGTRAATGAAEGSVRVWSVGSASARPRLERTLRGKSGAVRALAFSRDGGELVAVAGTTNVLVWRTHDGALLHEVHAAAPVSTAAVSPDGGRLVTTTDRTGQLWDLATGKVEHSLVGHVKPLTSATFSPDGRWVVTTSFDRDARIWDAESGKPRWLLTGGGDYAVVSGADFSADGRWVVTAGPGWAGVWSVRDGRLLFFMKAHEPLLSRAAFSHHGWRIATGGGQVGKVETYDCRLCGTIDDLLTIARRRLASASG